MDNSVTATTHVEEHHDVDFSSQYFGACSRDEEYQYSEELALD